MARTVTAIKKEMTDKYLSHEYIRSLYSLEPDDNFEDRFSTYSVESILFYVFAFAIWTLEMLFDTHSNEVTQMISEMKPHTLKWYVNKAKLFMAGYTLVEDSDIYDISALTQAQIDTARVVKYAAAVESNAVVYVKVAGSDGQAPTQLAPEHEAGLISYFKEVKDAGVKLVVVNLPADHMQLQLKIYYNPMVLNSNGLALLGGDPVRDTIRQFIANLPFNGEYRNSALVDALQAVPGVVMPELVEALVSPSGNSGTYQSVDGFAIPDSGYYKIYNASADLIITFVPYETVSD